ncbi:MAG: DNA-binding response regulator, partial [Ardenticatenales bacterium]|nr:DNA-binding response regulator [Ardenticatenales bacterium]
MTNPLLSVPPATPPRLLVVDDEPPIRQALCRALTLVG